MRGLIERVRLAALAAIGLVLLAAGPANAEWRRAESERFVVYSGGTEYELRNFVQKLETYDRILRYSMGLPMDGAPLRKLPIYIVAGHRGLEEVWPTVPDAVAGFYSYSEDDIFAVAMRDDSDDILLHEYAHHAMMQNAPFPYPAWFVEGFAEYFATADIRQDRVQVGRHSQARTSWLLYSSWMSVDDLLRGPSEETENVATYYPMAWLLTHWFLSDTTRNVQLTTYLRAVGDGADPVTAMQQTTGLTPNALERTLRTYLRGALPFVTHASQYPRVEMTVTRLPESANTLLLLNLQLKRSAPDEDDKPETIAHIRAATARFPNDPFAQLVLGRGEIIAGDRTAGETVLTALLEREPDNVEALQLMATARMAQAADTDDAGAASRLQRQARGFLARAYRVDEANYVTLFKIAESRRFSDGYPEDNDVQTLRLAYALAPQLPDARFQLAAALISRDARDEAIALLEPLANDPHSKGMAEAARTMIAQARSGASGEAALATADAASEAETDPETPED